MGTLDYEALVRSLIASGESFYVEFKSAYTFGRNGRRPRDVDEVAKQIAEAMVAFANSDGGDLLVGVEDDGSITGIPWEGDEYHYLVQQAHRLVRPRDPGASVFQVKLDGQRVMLFRIPQFSTEPLATWDGRTLWRKEKQKEPVPAGEIERRRQRLRGDGHYEAEPAPSATLDDIQIPDSVRTRVPALANLDTASLLRYWNLVEARNGTLVLRRAALLLFAKEPLRWHSNNRLRLRRVFGDQEGYGRDLRTRETEVLGPIPQILEQGTKLLLERLEVEARVDSLFRTIHILPREAVEECLVNAVAHRNYAIEGQACEIVFYSQHVEFRSPGNIPPPLTLDDLRQQRGVRRSRNPIIMRVLRDLGWSRDQGEGMRRIFAAMAQLELHSPELEEIGDTFVVRLIHRSLHDEATQSWLAAYGPHGLMPHQRRFVLALRQAGGRRSIDRLARQLRLTFDATRRALQELEQKAIVWHAPKSRSYRLVEPLEVPHELALKALSEAGFDPGKRDQLIPLTELARALRLTENAVASLAERWKMSGILTPAGAGRFTFGPSFLAYLAKRGD